jgi:hypothetical protein
MLLYLQTLGLNAVTSSQSILMKMPYSLLISPMHTMWPTQFIPLHLITLIVLVKTTNYKGSHYAVFCSFLLLRTKCFSQHPILSYTFNWCSSYSVRDKFHIHKGLCLLYKIHSTEDKSCPPVSPSLHIFHHPNYILNINKICSSDSLEYFKINSV